jgi:hypothetical protein
VRKAIVVLLLSIMAISLPVFAKDKQYQDGTLLKAEKGGPNLAQAIQAAADGAILGKVWVFVVQVGDFTYGASVEHGKVKEGEWQPNSQVKLRFDIKGGGVATRTTMFIMTPENKEIELEVRSIRDQANNEFCGKRKCDPESAVKKSKEKNSNKDND